MKGHVHACARARTHTHIIIPVRTRMCMWLCASTGWNACVNLSLFRDTRMLYLLPEPTHFVNTLDMPGHQCHHLTHHQITVLLLLIVSISWKKSSSPLLRTLSPRWRASHYGLERVARTKTIPSCLVWHFAVFVKSGQVAKAIISSVGGYTSSGGASIRSSNWGI